jgi:hypothetical protein
MRRGHRRAGLIVAVLLYGAVARAQNIDIVVHAVDGRNGRPLAHERLLVFTGASAYAVQWHPDHVSLTTDKDGLGTLEISAVETQWIQVWVDGRVLCQSAPKENSFSVSAVMSGGLAAPNTCSAVVQKAAPGHFIVFARPATFMEKMRR